MQAGTLNEIIVIERQEWDKSEFGSQKTKVWKEFRKTRACVDYKNGGRIEVTGELFFAKTVVFGIRIYNDIKELDRIVWKGQTYRILNIEYDRPAQRKLVECELWND